MLPPFNEDKDLENEIDDHINLYKDPWNRFYKIVIESQVPRSKNEGTRWKINQKPNIHKVKISPLGQVSV